MLLAIVRQISAESGLRGAVARILDIAATALQADRLTLFLVSPETGKLYVGVSRGAKSGDSRRLAAVQVAVNMQSIAGFVASTGEAANVPNPYQDSRFNPMVDRETGFVTRSILCVPLKNRDGQVVAVLQAVNKQ